MVLSSILDRYTSICGKILTPGNGKVDIYESDDGTLVAYECDFGYNLVGHGHNLCQSDKTWSTTVPYCKREEII